MIQIVRRCMLQKFFYSSYREKIKTTPGGSCSERDREGVQVHVAKKEKY